jgi:nucleotide-binding universal stress UspA family protein
MGTVELVDDFFRVRRQADLAQALARLTGKSVDLLDFEEVRQRLRAESLPQRVLKEIPVAAIVGSVGRQQDFTRDFKPRSDSNLERWTRVKAGTLDLLGLPPIEVYQVDQAYFVRDGHHRVSVARALGFDQIEAYVTELRVKVPVTPDMDMDDLAREARHVEFLERTGLDILYPGADLSASDAEAYDALQRHIAIHRHVLAVERSAEVPYAEAVADWYDRVYAPVAAVIREQGALADFPGRTEADVYLWVSGYRALLDEELDWALEDVTVGPDVPGRLGQVLKPLSDGVLDRLRGMGDGPKPGDWRRAQVLARDGLAAGQTFHLFTTLLAPVSGTKAGWQALDLALEVARRERGRVLGLHVAASEAGRDSEKAQAVRDEFEWRCHEAGVVGRLAVEVGQVTEHVCKRSGWADLTVLRLAYPPPKAALARFSSGMRNLLRCCHSPLLLTPGTPTPRLDRLLLAYDGSPKAEHALCVAAYLTQRWGADLAVVSVGEGVRDAESQLVRARRTLAQHGVVAAEVAATGRVAEAILAAAAAQRSGLIVVGGYGYAPVLELALGSTVDELMRRSRLPTLICP